MLSTSAFNALLKTLEEPPAHVKFMFATTDPEKVLPTILSRCQRFDLRRIPVRLIVTHLTRIAQEEKVTIDDAALHAIARGADGGMRDAESALDQLISFCGAKIVEGDVLSMFGLTAQGQILSMSRFILDGNVAGVLRELNELCRHGKDLGRLLADLLAHFRNVLVQQVSGGDTSLIEASEAELGSLREQAALISTEALSRLMEVLTDAESHLRGAASKKIFVEVALVKAIEARQAVGLDALLQQLARLRGNGGAPAPVAGAAAPSPGVALPAPAAPRAAPPAAPAGSQPPPPPTGSGSENLAGLWQSLIESVGRASAFVRTYLLQAFPVSLENKVLTVGFDPEFKDQADLVNNAKNHALITTKLGELGHPGVQVKFVITEAPAQPVVPGEPPGEAPAAAAEPPPAPAASRGRSPQKPAANDFKNDPLIARALEIFKGQIVDPRP